MNEESPLTDISQIGRHYLVKYVDVLDDGNVPEKMDNVGINRHYTEAFCMRKIVYESLLKLAENDADAQAMSDIRAEIESQKSDSLCLTIKRYAKNLSVSNFVHEMMEHE